LRKGRRFLVAEELLMKRTTRSVVGCNAASSSANQEHKGVVVMTLKKKHRIWAAALCACVGTAVLTDPAQACGGEWYPVMQVDPRIHGVARAESALSSGKASIAAASVIRMMPHIKSLKAKAGSLVGRAERVLALALARFDGSLPLEREVPREVVGSWLGDKPGQAQQNLAWSIAVLRRQADAKSDDVSLKTDLAEALARSPEHRAEARVILEELAGRDLVASPEGYATLAALRSASGDQNGQKLALQRCEAMAKSQAACVIRT
jgi:hypothetical protein